MYGSSQQCHELWQDNGIAYTPEHIAIYSKEMNEGAFGIANMFKDFIINNAQPKAEMVVNIWGEKFKILCNRFRSVGEKTRAFKAWDSVDNCYRVVMHTDTAKVPDLQQFRRYFVTLLIHNLDSQVADNVSKKLMKKYGWGLAIHDAFLCSPVAAQDVRKWYAKELAKIHANRTKILQNFFSSIGITAAANDQWNQLQSKVVKFGDKLVASEMALK